MIKQTSIMSNPTLKHTQSFKSTLQDLNGTQKFAQSPTYSKISNFKTSNIDQNRQKIEKRKVELLKLFKPTQLKQFNLSLLQNSPLMQTNEVFSYLVQKLKQQRHGMINVEIQEQKRKSPKPIENKIRQFLYNSLHEALLIPQSQLKQSKYLERLFDWFTEVFREREMKLGFKLEKKDTRSDDRMDEDWIIRNTYKSNMPLQLGQFHRKLLNAGLVSEVGKNCLFKDINSSLNFNSTFNNDSINQNNLSTGCQQKLYTLPSVSNASYSKSSQLLPVLNARAYMSKLIRNREEKENKDLQNFQEQWKKSRSHFLEHSTKNYQGQKDKRKTLDKIQNRQTRKNKQNDRPLSLNTKVLQKIQAARLGVTCTEFRKNKESILKQKPNQTYNSPVFHPYLTSSYFHDIKKKRLQTNKKKSFPHLLRSNQMRNSEGSEEMNRSNKEIDQRDFEDQKCCQMLFADKNNQEDQHLESVDGLGLSIIIGEKKQKAKKKQHKQAK